jgi:hypothetical protein
MVGEVFEVCEIDAYGHALIEKWFEKGRYCHSLAVEAHEVEIVV